MSDLSHLTDEQRKLIDEQNIATIITVSEWLQALDDNTLTVMGGVFQRIWLERFAGSRRQ